MSTMPPQKDEPDDIEAEYRRWSASDTARPADSVRTAVLAHAARLAAERRNSLPSSKSKRARYRWAAPIFGGLAAAALVGFLVIPRFIDSGQSAGKSADALVARDAQSTTLPQAPPPGVAAKSPAPARESIDAKATANASSSATSRAKRTSPASPSAPVQELNKSVVVTGSLAGRSKTEAAPNGGAEAAADSAPSARLAASAPSAAFRPRAGFTATAGSSVDIGAELRRSANLGDFPGVTALLGGKVDLESRDSAGRTALMLAASSGRTAVVNALLARGADPNATDSYGATPLGAALAGNYAEIADALKRAGAH
jgi:ankyrin repeat protein